MAGSWTGRRFGAPRHGIPAGHIRFGEAGPAAGAVAGSAETSGAALHLRNHRTCRAVEPGHELARLPTGHALEGLSQATDVDGAERPAAHRPVLALARDTGQARRSALRGRGG